MLEFLNFFFWIFVAFLFGVKWGRMLEKDDIDKVEEGELNNTRNC